MAQFYKKLGISLYSFPTLNYFLINIFRNLMKLILFKTSIATKKNKKNENFIIT